ncbi:MAG: TIGR04551 family protein [Myxococcales bacterium]|nr:TIGR04551 family protein [Myxococcales bacterium]
MHRWLHSFSTTATVVVLLGAHPALAQMGGGGAPGGGGMRPMGPGQGPSDQKTDEGPAEAAPETAGQEPALQPLPAWPGQKEKQLQFLQVSGYLRGRAYLLHNFNLGIPLADKGPRPPFFVPYSEFGATGDPSAPGNAAACASPARDNKPCRSENLTSADMRFRLEPTINVTEQVRVRTQIDIFDNYVMGSAPEGYYLNGLSPSRDVPLQAFSRTQVAPESGRNAIESAIRIKRAWAEVRTPIGELRFGRMPSHWGSGMLVNNGDCLDCDYGVNADRVMFATKFKEHFLALLWDWVATGPTTRLYQGQSNQSNGVAYNADTLDDVSQWGLAIGRQDKPEELKEKVERGELVVNYGGYFVYRRQDWDMKTNPGAGQGGVLTGTTDSQLSQNLTPRGAWAIIPDLWFRLNYRKFHIEAEFAMIGGKINTVNDQLSSATKPLTILQWGGTLRADYKFLHDALHVGIEVGSASGDQAEDPNAVQNYRLAQRVRPPGQTRFTNFNFDPDYHVDLILFRRILGTVTNATYFKPHASYDIIDSLSARLDVIYAIANVPVAYPGNSINLGVELDGSVMYHNDAEGFYAGVSYGVLFPLGALNIPGEIYPGYGKEAEAAQTFQGRLVVKF